MLIWLCCFAVPVAAQEAESIDTSKAFTDHQPLLAVSRKIPVFPEQVGMIYFKMTEQEPDFRAWAMASPRVATAKIVDRNQTFISEYNRMKKAFRTFQPEDIITVHVELDISQYSDIQNLLVLDQFNERTYFSYNVYGTYYGIIPNGIEKFNLLRLTPMELRGIRELTGVQNTLNAEIVLIPRIADNEKPMTLNDRDHWLIMADIAEIRFWGGKDHPGPTGGLGWFYRAEGYEPEENDELMNLFGQ